MFVMLSKILPLFVYPLGMVFWLLILAVLFRQRQRFQTNCLLAALAIILISGNSWVSLSLARALEWQYLPPETIPHVDAIVVLGGGTDPLIYPRSNVEINGAGDRMLYAARLYHAGYAPHILLSGGRISWLDGRQESSAEEMADMMLLFGVPEEALWLQSESRNTYEDAFYSTEILEEKGIDQILLVTSAQHMPRSIALFQKQGLEVIPMPTDFGVTQAGWDQLTQPNLAAQILNLFPSIGNMGTTSGVMKEYIGMFIYRLRGWL
jgi:uncharacterized SAM-binding protein YcdF (DUF218 family)